MSLPEILLWQRLKGSPQGISFRKQHPIKPYRADFYCASAKLVIELDGLSHDMGDRPERDERRAGVLMQKGYRVIRIAAAEVLRDPEAIADSIVALAKSSPFTGRGTVRSVVEGGQPPAPGHADTPLHLSAAPSGPPPRKRGGAWNG